MVPVIRVSDCCTIFHSFLMAYACKRRIEEREEPITEGHNLHGERERLGGAARSTAIG